VKAAAQRDAERADRFRRMLAISVMSALTLGAVLLARAETWVTVNPDGSVTKTETRVQASQTPQQNLPNNSRAAYSAPRNYDQYPDQAQGTYGSYNGVEQPVLPSSILAPGVQTPNTTFFAGTYYPVPTYSYSYPIPGYSYPVGPGFPNNVPPPMITTLPSQGYYYGYNTPRYCVPTYPAPPVGYYPYPVYNYPNYATSGVYYSGPAGGGGTIYSSSSSSSSGFGVSIGNGVNINLGNRRRSSNSTTTVTTTAPRY
jgi:hypothetical protein